MGKKEAKDPVEYLVAGGIAGIVSRTCIAPIERVKIIYQINRGKEMTSYLELAKTLVKKEGVLAMWKGNSVALIRVIPYMSLTFFSFEEYRAQLSRRFPSFFQ